MNTAVKESLSIEQLEAVNRAFSKQSEHYDEEDRSNPILQDMRQQVYAHVQLYLKPESRILELNSGTGIDAFHFATLGHKVHATDVSTGMIDQIRKKVNSSLVDGRLSCQQLSYDKLQNLSIDKVDYIFSNFGGLNCIRDLSEVTKSLPSLLKKGGYVTFVIMPRLSIWELLWIIKGDFKQAFRRLHHNGVKAHLEGEFFETFYHSLNDIKKAFGPGFKLIRSEGLCSVSPPPSPKEFALRNPGTYRMLRKMDSAIHLVFPFNRWADHLIVTFKLLS